MIDENWGDRVAFGGPGGVVAFTPGVALVPQEQVGDVDRPGWSPDPDEPIEGFVRVISPELRELAADPARDVGEETLAFIDELRDDGIEAQPEHVFFADAGRSLLANPFAGNPFAGNPFAGNPFAGNPFAGNPFAGNPFAGNPFAGHPFAGNPWACQPCPTDPFVALSGCLGRDRTESTSSAQPTTAPAHLPEPAPAGDGAPTVLVLDTGLPVGNALPRSLAAAITQQPNDQADSNGDGRLDPVAGHGTFIAGIISRLAPGCRVIVHPVLTGFGDGREGEVARVLRSYAGKVDLVNLSFGTYTPYRPRPVARAVRAVQRGIGDDQAQGAPPRPAVVVASAGNDGTWVAPYPALLPGVVPVAALATTGPAWFSNYGPWVRACAPGVDVVSTFFHQAKTEDGRPFHGWACWSGTSFAAPVVVGALARAMTGGVDPMEAVRRVIDAPGLLRLSCHGTVVTGV
jgi:hypothetical protein